MVKDPSSLYTPGRRGLSWIKLKKDFATLDVAVVAVEYGHGRRSKVLSDYTFAVRAEPNGALLPIGSLFVSLRWERDLLPMFPRGWLCRGAGRLRSNRRSSWR
jgi:ATP-dependent DNA ligase